MSSKEQTMSDPVFARSIYQTDAGENLLPTLEDASLPLSYREESVSYKVVVEGVSAMATKDYDDELKTVKEALPSPIGKESLLKISMLPTKDQADIDKKVPPSFLGTEILGKERGSPCKVIAVDDSCPKQETDAKVNQEDELVRDPGGCEDASKIQGDDRDSLSMASDSEDEKIPSGVPRTLEETAITELARAISEDVTHADLKDSDVQMMKLQVFSPGNEVITFITEQEETPKGDRPMAIKDDVNPEDIHAGKLVSASVPIPENTNNQNFVIASEPSIHSKKSIIKNGQPEVEASCGVDLRVDGLNLEPLALEEGIVTNEISIEESLHWLVRESIRKTENTTIKAADGHYNDEDVSPAANSTSFGNEVAKECKSLILGEDPSAGFNNKLSVHGANSTLFEGHSGAGRSYNIPSTMEGLLGAQLTTSIATNDECKDADALNGESVRISQRLITATSNLTREEKTDHVEKLNQEVAVEYALNDPKGIIYDQYSAIGVNEASVEPDQAGNTTHPGDVPHGIEVQKDFEPVVAVTPSAISYLNGTSITKSERQCEDSTLVQEEMISLHVDEHLHGCVLLGNDDKCMHLVKDDKHVLVKKQDFSKANDEVTGKEKVSIGINLPLIVTGIAIAAVGVGVASLSRCR